MLNNTSTEHGTIMIIEDSELARGIETFELNPGTCLSCRVKHCRLSVLPVTHLHTDNERLLQLCSLHEVQFRN